MWSFQCKRYSLFFLAFNNPCTWDNSCFCYFGIVSCFPSAPLIPDSWQQCLCQKVISSFVFFVFSAALTIPDHCWWSGHSVSPANPGARLFEGQRHLYTTTSLPRAPLLPPSISQSTMKRVTIRAGALLFRSQCLLSNNIICHRGRNLGGCAPVLDSQYLHCFEVERRLFYWSTDEAGSVLNNPPLCCSCVSRDHKRA